MAVLSSSSSLLFTFKTKIEQSVALVPDMVASEKLKAVQFWNVISERLQEIVNNSAADINALALKMEKGSLSHLALNGQHARNPAMTASYMDSQAFPADVYGGGYTSHENVGGPHGITYMDLPPGPEEISSLQPMSEAGFTSAALGPHNPANDPASSSSTSASLLVSVQGTVQENSFLSGTDSRSLSSILGSEDGGGQNFLQGTSHEKSTKKKDSDANWVPSPKSSPRSKTTTKSKSPSKAMIHKTQKAVVRSDKGSSSAEMQGPVTNPPQELADLEEEVADDPESQEGDTKNGEPTEVIVVQTRKVQKLKECEVCLKKVRSKSALTAHMWTHRKPFNCTECGARFSSKNNLVVHQRKHSGEKPYGCTMCNASFTTHGNLKRHVKTHSGEKPWECSQCDNRFTEKKTLVVHMRRHTGEKPYQCHICERSFAQRGILQSHLAMHLGQKAHLCEHCGKAFRQRSQLRLHTMRHQGVRKFSCSTCPARFLTKGDLERHARTHTGERPFVCDVCGKTFTRQQSLTEHTNRHYGVKPYECTYCGKTYAEMSACYKHIKHHVKAGEVVGDVQKRMKVNTQERAAAFAKSRCQKDAVESSSKGAETESPEVGGHEIKRRGENPEPSAVETAGDTGSTSHLTPTGTLEGSTSY